MCALLCTDFRKCSQPGFHAYVLLKLCSYFSMLLSDFFACLVMNLLLVPIIQTVGFGLE